MIFTIWELSGIPNKPVKYFLLLQECINSIYRFCIKILDIHTFGFCNENKNFGLFRIMLIDGKNPNSNVTDFYQKRHFITVNLFFLIIKYEVLRFLQI